MIVDRRLTDPHQLFSEQDMRKVRHRPVIIDTDDAVLDQERRRRKAVIFDSRKRLTDHLATVLHGNTAHADRHIGR